MSLCERLVLGFLGYKAFVSQTVPCDAGKRIRLPLLSIVAGTCQRRSDVEVALVTLQQQRLIENLKILDGPIGPEVIWSFSDRSMLLNAQPYIPTAKKVVQEKTIMKTGGGRTLSGPAKMEDRRGRRTRGSTGGYAPRVGTDAEFDEMCLSLSQVLSDYWGLELGLGDGRNRLWTIHNHLNSTSSSGPVYIEWLSVWLRGTSRGWIDKVLPYAKVFRTGADTFLNQFMEYNRRMSKLPTDVSALYLYLLSNPNFGDAQTYGYPSAFDFPVQSIRGALTTLGAEVTKKRVETYKGGDLRKWMTATNGAVATRTGWNPDADEGFARRLKRDSLIRQGTIEGTPDAQLDHHYSNPDMGTIQRTG